MPDKTAKTVRIPVRVKDGEIEYFYEENTSFLKKIKDGTIMELIVPEYALQDKELTHKLNTEHEVFFLPKGTVLLADMNVEIVSADMKPFVKSPEGFIYSHGFEIELLEDQRLVLRGSKRAKLFPCKCKIPLLNEEAISLNHAYTLISQKVETSRSSHSGNVFNKIYYSSSDERYKNLGDLRDSIEAEYESDELIPSKENV